jgi:hypothetical protein
MADLVTSQPEDIHSQHWIGNIQLMSGFYAPAYSSSICDPLFQSQLKNWLRENEWKALTSPGRMEPLFDVEHDIVVHMPPISDTSVTVIALSDEPGRLRVVYDEI